jgi:chromosome segregation ATPase
MQIGSDEHKQEYFHGLQKEIQHNIWFQEFQHNQFQKQVEQLQAQKAEAEKEYAGKKPLASPEKKRLRFIEEGITESLLAIAQCETNQAGLRENLKSVQEYAKAQGW